MKKKLAKLTALILAGTLIFNGMNPISQAKNNDNGRMSEMERQEDKGNNDEGHYICESSVEESVEEPESSEQSSAQESLEETSEGEASEAEGASEEGTSETEGASKEGTSETEGTSEEGTSETEETSEEETSETEEEKTICINNIQLYDDNDHLYQSSEGIYYTNENKLKIKLDITETNTKVREIQINDKKVEFQHDDDKYVINNFGIENDTCELRIWVKTDSNLEANEAVAVRVDKSKPDIEVSNNIITKNDRKLEIEVFDGDGGSGVFKVFLDSDTEENRFTYRDGKYSYDFTNEIKNQEKTYTIHAEDNVGNKAEKKVTLKFDLSEPRIEVKVSNSPDMTSELCHDRNDSFMAYYTNANCYLQVSAKDDLDKSYESGLEDVKLYEVINGERIDTNIANNEVLFIDFETGNKQDTVKQYEVEATDEAGNTVSEKLEVVYDIIKPKVEIEIKGKNDGKGKLIGETFTEENVIEEKYFIGEVDVTVKVTDANFNSKDVDFQITPENDQLVKDVEWKPCGENQYTCTVTFTADGKYTFGFSCTDKAGNQSECVEEQKFIIDSVAPVIATKDVKGKPQNDKYYLEERQVEIIVTDPNFDKNSASFNIQPEGSQFEISEWAPVQGENIVGEGKDINQYSCVISFATDGKYAFEFQCSDLVGNVSDRFNSGVFIIDQTDPKIEVEFDNKSVNNGKYYSASRTATITIKEENFKGEDVKIEPADPEMKENFPEASAWSTDGMAHTAKIKFDTDGIYGFTVNYSDLAGRQAEEYVSDSFVIDTTAPKATIEYDPKESGNDKYYNTARTATVTVEDANFDESSAQFMITSDGNKPIIGEWVHVPGEGCRNDKEHSSACSYTCKVTFDKDGEYAFRFSCADHAGNKSNIAEGGSFIIDTTEPDISVDYGNDKPQNGKYYNNSRTATITIEDKAFSDELVRIEPLSTSDVNGLPAISGWTSNGDAHTARISFTEDGVYGFRVTCSDLAGNAAKDYVGEIFIIDRTVPEIVFDGVRNNSANNGVVAPILRYTDLHLDEAGTQVTLTGTNYGTVKGNVQKSKIENGIQMIYADFEHIQEMDDYYTLKVKAVDLAGNETEEELHFSVNRFGSTYRISADTQKLIDTYYTGKAPVVTVTEINIDELEYGEVTVSKDGQTITLVPGSDYSVTKEGTDEDWKSYTYSIGAGNFSKDGVYSVGFYSKDRAANASDNRIKGKEIEFALDTTAPSIVAEGIESDKTYNESSKEITVDVKDNMYLTELHVTDNGKTILEMSEKELKDTQGVVTFTLEEADELRDITITAKDIVGNEQRLEYNNIAITTKVEVIKDIETARVAKPDAQPAVSPVIVTADEDNRLLYVVISAMSAAVLMTAVGVYFRKKRKKN